MPRKPKHWLTTRKGFWKQLKGPKVAQDKVIADHSLFQGPQPLLEHSRLPVEQPASPAEPAEQHLLMYHQQPMEHEQQ